jgi:hypothetical protein
VAIHRAGTNATRRVRSDSGSVVSRGTRLVQTLRVGRYSPRQVVVTEIISRPCCDTHKDWPQLTQHLVVSFPDIPLEEIVGIVARTRQAEEEFGLPDAQHLATGEIIVRHQLRQLMRLDGSAARLDPGSHS